MNAFLLLASALLAVAEDPPYDIRAERQRIQEEYVRATGEVERAVREGRMSEAQARAELEAFNQRRFAQARGRGPGFEARMREVLDRARAIREEWRRAYAERTGREGPTVEVVRDPGAAPRRVADPGWVEPGNTGTPLQVRDPATGAMVENLQSRGVFGDQDLTFKSDADRAAFAQAAREKGYTVRGEMGEGYLMVGELDVVAHGPTRVPARPLEPQARLQTAELARGHESFATGSARQQWLPPERNPWNERDPLGRVLDNLKKAEGDLRRTPEEILKGLQEGRWYETETWAQNLAKAAGRGAMDNGGRSAGELQSAIEAARAAGRPAAEIEALERALRFREQLNAIKTGMDPRAVGLVPVGATNEEKARLLAEFQARCLEEFHHAFTHAVEVNRTLVGEMDVAIARLRSEGKVAEAARLAAERARILDGNAQALQHLATSPADRGRLMSEVIRGSRLEPVTTPGGTRYRDASGRLLTEEEALLAAREALAKARAPYAPERRTAAPREAVPPAGMSALEKGALAAAILASGMEGARKEIEAAEREGRPPSKVLAVLRSWLEFTGVPGVIEVSSEIWRDQLRRELDRIEEMVRRGEQPSAIWSSLRQWTISLTRVAGAVTGVSSILEAGDEYLGLLAAQLERPPGDLDALVRARSAKLLALLEEELAGLRGLRDQVAALVAEARPPVDEMKKAALRLWTGRFRLEEARRNIRTLRELCEDARERRARIDAEEPAFARAIGEARRALAALERAAEEACAAASSGRSPGRAREAGAAAAALAGSAAEDAERMLAGLREPARRLAEDLPKLRRLLDTTSPRTAAALLAITLEETRSAGERASGPLEAALFLGAGVEERLARIERRAELLIHAGAAAERCRALVEEARRVQGELEGAGARRLGLEVNGAVSQAYEDWGAARGVDVEPLQREWERACPEPPAAFDPATIDAKERELRDVRDAAERARVRLDECTGRASVAVARPELYTTRDAEGTRREQVFSAGESLFLQVELAVERLAEPTAARVQAAVTRPDGRRVELREASVDLVPGTERYRVPFPLRVGADASAGTYAAEATVRVADRSSPRGTAGFEVRGRPIEAMRLTVTDGPDSDREASPFRPADPIGFRLRYRGQGPPGRALRVRLEVRGPDPGASRLGGEWSEELLEGDRVSARGGALPEVLLEGTYTAVAHVSVEGGAEEAVPAGFEVKYPVEITEVRLMDEQDAPRSEYAPGAPFRWLMQFRFQNTRPGDRFASFLECRAGDARIDALSSPIYGPDPVNAESGWTLHTGTIPEGLPPGRYVVVGGVDLAGGRYLSRPVAFAVTSGAEVAITSPANGFRVSEKVLALTGTCSDRRLTEGVMVTNGQAVPIKLSNGRFEAKTVLRPGANRIQIGVRTPAGDRWAEVGGTADIAAAALKVVLSWQAQTADVDLWVHDPEREVTNYQRKRPAAGARSLDVDDTNGPGMETYTIEKPLRGRYVVAVHYYSAHSWRGPVPVSVQITRWEGTQSESHETRVGTLTVAAGNDNRPGAVVWFEVDL